MEYQRNFIMLNQDTPGYGLSKAPVGRALIEARGNKCKITVNVQELKFTVPYKIHLILKFDNKFIGVPVGTLHVDQKGRGEFRNEFDVNSATDGAGLGSLVGLAVLVGSKKDICPLVGYKDIQVSWKSTFEIKVGDKDAISISKADTMRSTVVEPKISPKDGEEHIDYLATTKLSDEKYAEAVDDDDDTQYADDDEYGDIDEGEPAANGAYLDGTDADRSIGIGEPEQFKFEQPQEITHERAPEPETTAEQEPDDTTPDDIAPSSDTFCNMRKATENIERAIDDNTGETRQQNSEPESDHSVAPKAGNAELDHIFCDYVEMNPFSSRCKDIKWVRVSLKEPIFLNLDYRAIICHPFVVAAYKKYRHLMIGRTNNCEYILGVPGVFEPRYRSLAQRLGFTRFKCVADTPTLVDGEYGYWLMKTT
ncbi:MAG: hypothetical protein LBL96_01560 [Clostridiales bacterium]|nr:hypothetical protein [Clostridiales bacterium]